MLIDCDTCAVRGDACGDCVITVLLASPPLESGVEADLEADRDGVSEVPLVSFDEDEARALDALAAGGLVPPLRLVRRASGT